MNCPNLFNSDELTHWSNQKEISPDNWVAARPLGLQGLFLVHRLRLAWRVFKGQYDVVKWTEQ